MICDPRDPHVFVATWAKTALLRVIEVFENAPADRPDRRNFREVTMRMDADFLTANPEEAGQQMATCVDALVSDMMAVGVPRRFVRLPVQPSMGAHVFVASAMQDGGPSVRCSIRWIERPPCIDERGVVVADCFHGPRVTIDWCGDCPAALTGELTNVVAAPPLGCVPCTEPPGPSSPRSAASSSPGC